MTKIWIFLEEIVLSLAIAASIGTWVFKDSFACGNDLFFSLQSIGPMLLWLAPAYLFILFMQLVLKKSAPLINHSPERQQTIKFLRPFYLCFISFFNPSFSYFFIGIYLFIFILLWISLRRFSLILLSEQGKAFTGKLEEQIKNEKPKFALVLTAAVFIIYLLIISGVFAELPQPEGDEPHYLTTAYSILKDGDLQLANNYQEQHFRLWHQGWIQAHTKAGKNGMSEQYSMHNIGLSLYMVPFLQAGIWFNSAAAIHFSIRLGMIILASIYIGLLFLLLFKLSSKGLISLGITLLVAFTAPVLFFSYHCFTEIAAALLFTSSFYILWRQDSPSLLKRIVLGLCLGALPWLGVKYLLLAGTFVALWVVKEMEWKLNLKKILAVAIPGIILGSLFFIQTYDLFGTFSPSAYYLGADTAVTDKNIVFKSAGEDLSQSLNILSKTVLSYFIDQREGLLFYSPWYLLGLAGLISLLISKKKDERKLALWLLLLTIPFIILYGLTGFGGGHSPPSRSLMPILFIFIIPAVMLLKKGIGWLSEVLLLIILVSLAAALALLLNPSFLYHDFHVPASHLLQWISSPALEVNNWFPSINSKHFENWPVSFAWLALIALLIIMFSSNKLRQLSPHWNLKGFAAVFLAISAIAWSIFAKVPPGSTDTFKTEGHSFEVSFANNNVFIDKDGFWVKTGSKEICYFYSPKALDTLTLNLRSITPNNVIISDGMRLKDIKFLKNLKTRFSLALPGGFKVNGKQVYRFSIISMTGNPPGLGIDNGDERPLGVEVRPDPGN